MSDNDFLKRIEKTYGDYRGEAWSPEKTIESFQLYDVPSRVAALEQLDEEMANADTSELRSYSKLGRLHADVNRVHQQLLKAGR